MVPDYPRLPPSYSAPELLSATQHRHPHLRATIASPRALRAALALTSAAHAGEDVFGSDVGFWKPQGELRPEESVGDLLELAQREATADTRIELEYLKGDKSRTEIPRQSTPLRVVAEEVASGDLSISLSFDPSVVEPLEAEWFLSHLTTSFNYISSAPLTSPISAIPLVADSELRTIATLSKSPSPPDAYPPSCITLPSFFLHAATITPSAPALQFDDIVLTFAQLRHLGQFFASHLTSLGVQPGSVVPLCAPKSVEMVVGMLGILLAGCGYLNLEPAFPAGRKEHIVRELRETALWSGVGVIMGGSGEEEVWSSWKETGHARTLVQRVDIADVLRPLLASLDSLERDFPLPERPLPTPRPCDPAYLIYTSGSTGTPKGIVVEHRNVAAFLRNYRGVFGRAPGERVLQFPSSSFDVMVMNIWDTFAHGATLCMTSQSALLSDLAGAILRLECTLVDLTPTIGALLFDYPDAKPRPGETVRDGWRRAGFKIKVVNTGGEKVERWVRDAWIERGVRVVIDYGPTETTVGVISNQRTTSSTPGVPIGRPTGLNFIHILSPSLAPVPLGCVGEICVAGEQVSRGYVKSALNEDVFVEHPVFGRIYRTGDLGRFLGDGEGNIECLGRRDGQVKVNGLRIEIGEIEQHLTPALHPCVQRGVVDRLEGEDLAPGLVAFLVLSPTSPLFSPSETPEVPHDDPFILPFASSPQFRSLVSDVTARLATSLPSYMLPRYWLPVSRIPTQGMGKADRKTLRHLAETYFVSASASAAPSSSTPRAEDEWHAAVHRTWSGVLRVDPNAIENEDSFSRLGGDSIAFMKVVSMLRAAGYRVSFADLADAPTLTACAEVLRRSAAAASSSPPTPAYTEPFSLVPVERREAIFEELESEYGLRREDVDDFYPTAPAQDAILSASVDSTQYYAQAVYDLNPSVSIEVLGKAMKRLVGKHGALRTCFAVLEASEGVIQVVLEEGSEQVSKAVKLELRRCEAGNLPTELNKWLDEDRAAHVFQWGRLALSLAVFADQDDNRSLAWSMHHAMSDGWTLELLTSDLRALCHDLPLLDRPPFASIVAWSSLHPTPTPTRDFWETYLKGASRLGWPGRQDSKPFSTSGVAVVHWSGELLALGKRHGITPAIASRVAIAVALSRHASTAEVTLGIVRSGRDIDLERGDEVVGPCVSVLPSRILLPSSPSSPSLLDLSALEIASDRLIRTHQNITLSALFSLLHLRDRAALFDVLVTYQSLAERSAEEEALAPWPIRQPPKEIRMPTNYALSFEITPGHDEPAAWEFTCFFDTNAVHEEEVREVLGMVLRVMDYLVTAPCTTVERIDFGDTSAPRKPEEAPTMGGAPKRREIEEGVLQPLLKKLEPIWVDVLRVKGSELSWDDTWASLGGDSIAVMRLSAKLKRAGIPIPVQDLAGLTTMRQQAGWLADQVVGEE